MKTSTHLRLANLVASELGIKLDSEECAYLRGGSVEPDKWRDYPHHFAVDGKLENYILQSRRYLLEGNQNAHLECLGIAFHYIADKWTLFSGSASEHANWENKIDKCNVGELDRILYSTLSSHSEILQDYLEISQGLRTAPRGKDSALANVFKMRPRENGTAYSSPDIDFNIAFRMCLAIGISVRSMTVPPNELVNTLNLLIPWNDSKELSERVPPKELEPYFKDFLSHFQQKELELTEKQENLKEKHSNLLKNMLFKLRTKVSILKTKQDISRAHDKFKRQVEPVVHQYQRQLDWYYWGLPKSPSLRTLKDLFDNNDTTSCLERERIKVLIQEKTLRELVERKKQGYQLVVPEACFSINATFNNPTNYEIKDASVHVYTPDNWGVEVQPSVFTIPSNGSISPQARIKIPNKDKLANYILEWRFLIPSTTSEVKIQNPSAEKIGDYSVEWAPPSVKFTADRSCFIKLTVVSNKIRKDWTQKSIEGVYCGAMGCDEKQLDWKCPKCKLHFCNTHRNHINCEELSKL